MDFGDDTDEVNDGGAEDAARTSVKLRRMADSNQPFYNNQPRRQLDRDQIMAIGAYAATNHKSFSEVSLETVIADGGVEERAAKAQEIAQAQL